MNPADSPSQGQGQATAAGQEPFIPKHRFDELNARLKEVEQREKLKDQLYMEQLQQQRQAQRPQEQELELRPEDTGLDPQTHQAALKIAKAISTQEVQKFRKEAQGYIGQLANELEVNKFLVQYGPEKGKYIDQIRDQQQKHRQMTGSYMDVETAYKLVRFDEMEARSRRGDQGAQAPTEPAAQPQAPTPPSYPNPAATRAPAPAPVGGTDKSFSELSFEEQEARLEAAFGEHGPI